LFRESNSGVFSLVVYGPHTTVEMIGGYPHWYNRTKFGLNTAKALIDTNKIIFVGSVPYLAASFAITVILTALIQSAHCP
jgi:hypothetical protein